MRTNPLSTSPCHGPPAPEPAAAPCHARPAGPVAPLWPGLSELQDLTGLAGEARADAHRANVRVRQADAREYARYLDAYLEGARRCRTIDELRRYGRPAGVAETLERGARIAESLDLDRPYQARLHELLHTNMRLGDLILRLERRPVPLDVFFDVSLTAKIEVAGRSFGGTISSRDGAAAQVGAGGVTLEPGKLELGADAGVAGVKATFTRGRLESVEVSAPAAPGVRAVAKQSRGAVEQGIAVGGRAGGEGGAPAVEVEARASVGVTLLTAEVVQRAISRKSFWDGEQ